MASLEKQLQEKSSAYSQAALANTELQSHLQVQNTLLVICRPRDLVVTNEEALSLFLLNLLFVCYCLGNCSG